MRNPTKIVRVVAAALVNSIWFYPQTDSFRVGSRVYFKGSFGRTQRVTLVSSRASKGVGLSDRLKKMSRCLTPGLPSPKSEEEASWRSLVAPVQPVRPRTQSQASGDGARDVGAPAPAEWSGQRCGSQVTLPSSAGVQVPPPRPGSRIPRGSRSRRASGRVALRPTQRRVRHRAG